MEQTAKDRERRVKEAINLGCIPEPSVIMHPNTYNVREVRPGREPVSLVQIRVFLCPCV